MGALKLSEFHDEISSGLQRTNLTNDQMTRWVNMTLREIIYAFKFREFETSVTFAGIQGDYDYTIGSGLNINITDFRAIHEEGIWVELPDTERKELLIETRERWLEIVTLEAAAEGIPTHYHKFGSEIFLRPVPDAVARTFRLHYWKSLVKLSGDNDVTPIFEDWDEAVLLGSLARGYRYYGEEQRMVNRRNEMLGYIRSRALEIDLEPFPEGGISLPGITDTEASLARSAPTGA